MQQQKKKKKKREPAFVHAPAPDKPDVYLGLHTPYMQASSLSARESSRGAEAMRGLLTPPPPDCDDHQMALFRLIDRRLG